MFGSGRLVTLGLAVACIAAFAVAGSTLDSSVTTTPDEAIDIDTDQLPVGSDGARQIREQVQEAEEGSPSESSSSGQGDSSSASAPDDQGGQGTGPSPDSGQDQGPGPGDGPGQGPGEPDLLDSLLPYLLALLALLVALLVAALLYRYRDRIRALLLALFGGALADEPERPRPEPRESWGDVEPSNPVYRAWLGLVSQLDVDRPETMTARECEALAVERGMDPDAVDTLGNTFREARYSGRSVTDDQVERARRSADRLGLGGVA